jgi:cytidylate kinase
LLTEFLTLNIGESPSVVVESTLSSILEAQAPEKYYLSAKACEGILRRAERRGKQLPPMLKSALEQMIERERAQTEPEEDDSWML